MYVSSATKNKLLDKANFFYYCNARICF